MTKRRILVTGELPAATRAALERRGAVTIAPDASADTLRRAARDADVLVVRHRLPEDLFEAAPQLLGVVRHGAGGDFIPVGAATARGILVANVPGANAGAVAEYCVMQILNLLRSPQRAEALMREVGWDKARGATPNGRELRGLPVGILGYGAIGSRLAHILSFGFQAQVKVWMRRPERLPAWAAPLPIERLLAESDIIVPCVPHAAETHHLLSADRIAQMKPSTLVVNASRGAVIDEAALLSALREGRLAGAALDVFEAASPQPGEPLLRTGNLLVTPHMAGNTREAHSRIGIECTAEIIRILDGERPRNLVNPEAWGRHLARRAT